MIVAALKMKHTFRTCKRSVVKAVIENVEYGGAGDELDLQFSLIWRKPWRNVLIKEKEASNVGERRILRYLVLAAGSLAIQSLKSQKMIGL